MIYSPESIIEKKIDLIIISSKDYEDEIYESIKQYEKYGIKILKCYS